ncbi:MAG: hypothetical protein GQ565_01460 [Candidatus Aegiribacteria sp.]|nr:hypothetical protein [Candidatus Aegiribacteria sp.]
MNEGRRPLWYLYLLLKNRWFLVKALLIIMIPTVVITFMLEKKYTVTTVIMPPEEQSTPSLSIAGLGGSDFAGYFSGGMGFSLPLMTTMSDVYDEILKSRSLAEHVILSTSFIDSTDLRSIYDKNEQLGLYWARMKFRENFSANVTPSGFLRIEYTSGNPWYAVEISESIVSALDSINIEIISSRLRHTRDYLELRLETAENTLVTTSLDIKRFEDEHDMVAPEQEMTAYINRLVSLKTEYSTLITEVSALRQGLSGAASATILFKERKAEELLDVLKMLESGVPAPGYEDVMPSVNLDEFTDISFEYAILRADYEIALMLTNTIGLSLQEVISSESREQAHIRVIDPPRHPGWKSKPKRILILLEVFLLAFISLFGFLIARENIRDIKKKRPELWEPWRKLFEEIRRDFSFRRR